MSSEEDLQAKLIENDDLQEAYRVAIAWRFQSLGLLTLMIQNLSTINFASPDVQPMVEEYLGSANNILGTFVESCNKFAELVAETKASVE